MERELATRVKTAVIGCCWVMTRRPDDVPEIDQPEPDDARDGRRDAAVSEAELGAVDLGLIALDGRLILGYDDRLGIELLAGDRVVLDQRLIALQVDLGVSQARLVFGHLPIGLVEKDLERPGIDFHQEVAFADGLPFPKGDVDDLAVHPGPDGDRLERDHRAQPGEVDREVHAPRGGPDDRNGARGSSGRSPSAARRLGEDGSQAEERRPDKKGGQAPEPKPRAAAQPGLRSSAALRDFNLTAVR